MTIIKKIKTIPWIESRYIEKNKKFKLIDRNIVSIDTTKKKLLLKEKNKPNNPTKNKIFIIIKVIEKLNNIKLYRF